MPLTAANVLVGAPPSAVGGVYSAPTGTALPTTAIAALDAAFVDAGYVSEDGVTQSISSDTNDIKAWNGDTVRTVETGHSVTFQFTLLETSNVTTGLYYGNSLIEMKARQVTRKSWVIDVADGARKIRIVIPDGEITAKGDVIYKLDEAVAYDLTVTAYPNASGVKAFKYVV